MRLIDADALLKKQHHYQLCGENNEFYGSEDVVLIDDIEAAPTAEIHSSYTGDEGCPEIADVEEVVRCKDCRYLHHIFGTDCDIVTCGRTGLNMLGGNGFCSWGERKI